MAIDIEEVKQVPETVKEVAKTTTAVVVEKTEPFFGWPVPSTDASTIILIVLAVILIRPILAIFKYFIALGLIIYAIKYFA